MPGIFIHPSNKVLQYLNLSLLPLVCSSDQQNALTFHLELRKEVASGQRLSILLRWTTQQTRNWSESITSSISHFMISHVHLYSFILTCLGGNVCSPLSLWRHLHTTLDFSQRDKKRCVKVPGPIFIGCHLFVI